MSKLLLVVLLAVSTLISIGSCQETTTVQPTTSGPVVTTQPPTTSGPVETTTAVPTTAPPTTSGPVDTTTPVPTTAPPTTSGPVDTTTPVPTTVPPTTSGPVETTTPESPETTTPAGEVGGIACDNWRGDDDDPTVPNYGDMICEYAPGGELILRETLINQDVFLGYQKTLEGYTVGRVQALNFGDVKGFTTAIDIMLNGWSADVGVYVEIEPGQQMRMQVEVYGWKEE